MSNLVESFIPNAFDAICTRKPNHTTDLANYINGQTGEGGEDLTFEERFASTVFEAHNLRQEAPFKTLSVLFFLQTLMDQVCWNARRLKIALENADQKNEETGELYGIDRAAKARRSTGVSVGLDRIADCVESDYEFLTYLLSLVTAEINSQTYTYDVDVVMFNPSSLDEETNTWVNRSRSETWEEALRHMDLISSELNGDSPKTKLANFRENLKKVA